MGSTPRALGRVELSIWVNLAFESFEECLPCAFCDFARVALRMKGVRAYACAGRVWLTELAVHC